LLLKDIEFSSYLCFYAIEILIDKRFLMGMIIYITTQFLTSKLRY